MNIYGGVELVLSCVRIELESKKVLNVWVGVTFEDVKQYAKIVG